MNFALFTYGGGLFLLRWLHFLGGITWIGMLYYMNFTQGLFMAETDGPTKSQVTTKLLPRVLWYFRWGAMLTFLSGWAYLGMNHIAYHSSYGVSILTGMTLGSLMWANVWFIIWPAQQLNMKSAGQVAGGGQAIPEVPARVARATVASRTNVLFSIPLLFFMGAASHLGIQVSPDANLCILAAVLGVVILALELNAIKGKNGPMTTVKGVIHCGIGLTVVLYVIVELLTK
jgi:uncharacterized membrane protein